MEHTANFQLRINDLHQNITALQYTDTEAFPGILIDLLSLANDIRATNNDNLCSQYTPQLQNMYTYLKNKINTFITPLEQ